MAVLQRIYMYMCVCFSLFKLYDKHNTSNHVHWIWWHDHPEFKKVWPYISIYIYFRYKGIPHLFRCSIISNKLILFGWKSHGDWMNIYHHNSVNKRSFPDWTNTYNNMADTNHPHSITIYITISNNLHTTPMFCSLGYDKMEGNIC